MSTSPSELVDPQSSDIQSSTPSFEDRMMYWWQQMEILQGSQNEIEKAYLSQKKELESARDRVKDLEAKIQDLELRDLQSATTFDLTDEYISRQLDTFFDGLFSWSVDLPDPVTHLSHRAALQDFLKKYGSISASMDLTAKESLSLEPELVTAGAFALIQDSLFNESLVEGNPYQVKALETLYEGISTLEPRKKPEEIAASRLELVRIWTASPIYQKTLDEECERLSRRIQHHLGRWGYTCRIRNEKLITLKTQILSHGAQLGMKMQCSTETFVFGLNDHISKTVKKYHLENYEIINSKTHCKVPSQKFSSLPDSATIGEFVMAMVPPLYRKRSNGELGLPIMKGRILVKINPQILASSKETQRDVVMEDGPKEIQVKKEDEPSNGLLCSVWPLLRVKKPEA